MGFLQTFSNLLKAIRLLTSAIKDNTKALRLKKPGLVFLVFTKEVNEMLFFKLILPAISAVDVVTRKLTYKIGAAEPVELELTADEEVPELSGMDNEVVEGSLVDIDDAGNPSEPTNYSFVLVDTIAPPAPGEIGFEVTREE